MNKMNKIEEIKKLITPIVEEEGLILKDVSFVTEEGRRSLVVTIDSDKPITTKDCAKVSRKIDPILEENGLIEKESFLMVSSPGIDK